MSVSIVIFGPSAQTVPCIFASDNECEFCFLYSLGFFTNLSYLLSLILFLYVTNYLSINF